MIDHEESATPAPREGAATEEVDRGPDGVLPFAGGSTAYSPIACPRGARPVELGPGLPVSGPHSQAGLFR
jgi:hypothetical protein